MTMSDQVVREGKLVSLTYRIADERGVTLEQTDLPVTYIQGGLVELIGGMDKAIHGKRAGDEVELSLEPEAGFGKRDPDLVFTDDLDNVPAELRVFGAEVQMQNDQGEARIFHVTQIVEGRLTIDGNHRLAGKALKIFVRIHEVRDPIPLQQAQGLDGIERPIGRLH